MNEPKTITEHLAEVEPDAPQTLNVCIERLSADHCYPNLYTEILAAGLSHWIEEH